MSWSYIPGSLVTREWVDETLSDQDGTNIFLESRRRWLNEQNARDDEWAQSSYETDELFLQAITALRRAVQVASTVPVLVDFPVSNPEVPMTPDQARALPFMQRLTLYCGLILSTATELRSIARIAPATDVGDSSKDQESSESSPQMEYLTSKDPEPLAGSIVIDNAGDAWQRDYEGWNCAMMDNSGYRNWRWDQLIDNYSRLRLVYTPND
jgi:hypothetical protein